MRSFLQMQRDGQSRQAGLERGAQITGAPSAYAPRVTSDQRGSCARTKQAVSQHSGKQARERKGLKHTSGTIFSYGAGSSDRNNRNHPHRKPATVARAVGPFRIATKVRNSVNSIKNCQKLFNGKPKSSSCGACTSLAVESQRHCHRCARASSVCAMRKRLSKHGHAGAGLDATMARRTTLSTGAWCPSGSSNMGPSSRLVQSATFWRPRASCRRRAAGEPSSVTVYEAHGSAAGVNIGIGDRLEL